MDAYPIAKDVYRMTIGVYHVAIGTKGHGISMKFLLMPESIIG